jgi:hypothetical protein
MIIFYWRYAMNVLFLLLLFLALVCFVVAAVRPTAARVNLVAVGLACWVAVPFLQQFDKV